MEQFNTRLAFQSPTFAIRFCLALPNGPMEMRWHVFDTGDLYVSHPGFSRQAAFHAACMSFYAYGVNPDSNQAVKNIMSSRVVTYVSSNPLIPNMVIARDKAGVQIAIAGTSNVQQWLSYLTEFGVTNTVGMAGKIFTVFEQWSDVLLEQILAVTTSRDYVFLCGHSLGGAMAALLASKLRLRGYREYVNVYTVGCPRIGDSDYVNNAFQWGWHVRHVVDPVPECPPPVFSTPLFAWAIPRLPPMFRNGTDIALNVDAGYWINANSLVRPRLPTAWAAELTASLLIGHLDKVYIKEIWHRLTASQAKDMSVWQSICNGFWGLALPTPAPS